MSRDAIIKALIDACEQAVEWVEDYVDVNDGADGRPVANKAMRTQQLLQDAVADAKHELAKEQAKEKQC